MPNFKLKYDDLENIKTDCFNTAVFNLHEIKQLKFFWDTRYTQKKYLMLSVCRDHVVLGTKIRCKILQ